MIEEEDVIECYQVLFCNLEQKGTLPKGARVPENKISSIDWNVAGVAADLDQN